MFSHPGLLGSRPVIKQEFSSKILDCVVVYLASELFTYHGVLVLEFLSFSFVLQICSNSLMFFNIAK